MTTGLMHSDTSKHTSHNREWAMLIALTMLTTAGMTVVLPVMPFVVKRVIGDPTHLAIWVGILEAINGLCTLLVAPIFGSLSDRIGRRPIIIIGALGAAVGYFIFGVGGAIWVLLIGRIIQGLTAGDLPAMFAYLADITPANERAKRFGLLGALSGIGTMLGPAAGGLLASVNVDLPVFVTAGTTAAIGILAFFFLPESLPKQRRTEGALRLREINPFGSIKAVFARAELRTLFTIFVLIGFPFGFFINNYSVLALDQLAWDATKIGLLTACVGVIDIIIQGVLLRILLRKLGDRGVILAGVIAQTIGIAGLAVVGYIAGQPIVFIIGTLMLAAGQGATGAAMDGAMSNSVGDAEQGWVAGAMQSINAAIGVAAPLIAGVLYSGLGHAAPYVFGTILFVAACLLLPRLELVQHMDGHAQQI